MSSGWAAVFVGLCAFSFTFLTALVGSVAYFYKQMQTIGEMAAKDNDTLKAVFDKTLHDYRNEMQVRMGAYELEIKDLRKDTATKSELSSMEQRLTSSINKLEGALSSIAEKVAHIGVVSQRLTDLSDDIRENKEMLQSLISRNEVKDR